MYDGGGIGDMDGDSSGSVGTEDLWKNKVEPVLVLFPNSYSELELISVGTSSTLFIYLTLSTNYLYY